MGQDITAALKNRESNKLNTRLEALNTLMNTDDKQLGRLSAEELVHETFSTDSNAPADMTNVVTEYNAAQKQLKQKLIERM